MAFPLLDDDFMPLAEGDLALDGVDFLDNILGGGEDGQHRADDPMSLVDGVSSHQPLLFDAESEGLFIGMQQVGEGSDVDPSIRTESNGEFHTPAGLDDAKKDVTPPSTAPGSPTSMEKAPKTKQRATRKAPLVEQPKKDRKKTKRKLAKNAAPSVVNDAGEKNADSENSTSASQSSKNSIAGKSSSKRCYKKRRTEGLEGFLAAGPTIDEAIASGLIPPLPEGDTKEIRKQRRLIRNRVSAQLHRERKKLYVENLENRVREQADTIDELEAQVESLKAQLARAQGGGCTAGTPSDDMSGSTNGTLSNPTSSCERPSKRPKNIRLMGRAKPSHVIRQKDGSTSPANVSTDEETDRINSESSASDGESNETSRKNFHRPAPLDTKGLLSAGDIMNEPLLPTPKDMFPAIGDAGKGEADSKEVGSNPRKRAFFMMGMFLFTALFGGSILNLSRQDIDTGRSLASFSSSMPEAKAQHTFVEQNLVPHQHFVNRRRHLMSVEDNKADASVDLLPASHRQDTKAPSLDPKPSVDSRSAALWNDLVDMPVNGSGKCLAANLLSSVSSAVNASRALAKGKLYPAPSREDTFGKKLRGGDKAMVPYEDLAKISSSSTLQLSNLDGGRSRALSSVMTLQQHMQAAMEGPTENASTILCPKPYGILGANTSHAIDDSLVLLLPSSSVSQFLNTMHTEQERVDNADEKAKSSSYSEGYEWDGSWVEVDATITAIRHIPTYGGKLSGQANGAILL